MHRPPHLWWRLATWVALAMAGLSGRCAASDAAGITEITVAHIRPLDTAASAQTVTLPDTWVLRGHPTGGQARYSATFELQDTPPPDRSWALWATRMPGHHALTVNGTRVHDTLDVHPGGARRPSPQLIVLPGGLLHQGTNRLELWVEPGERAGLSTLQIGPLSLLQPRHQQHLHQWVEVPEGLNAAAAGVAGFMLLVGLLRRQELRMGCFGALALLASLRNLAYFSPGGPAPGPGVDLLFFLAQVSCVGLFGLFAMLHTGHRSRRYRIGLGLVIALALLGGVAGSLTHSMPLARRWVYPLLLLACLPAFGLLMRQALHRRAGPMALTPLTSWLLVLTGALHDYLYQTGRLPITHEYTLPLTVPVLVLAFAALQMRRLMALFNALDQLNTTLEQRVTERTQALDQAVQAKTQFLAAASHDLRQPMAAIVMLISLLEEQVTDRPALRTLAQRLHEAARAMSDLLDGLLDLSRLDSGHLTARSQPVALQPLMQTIARDLEAQANRQGLRLIVHPTTAVVQADPVLLEQVLRNLAGNAVGHTRHGGVLIGVRAAGPQQVRLVVHDTGPGIAEADRERVFDAFVQLDNPGRDRRRGLGLGLAIAQRSARLMASRLELRSRLGRGSCFSLVLPRAQAPAALPRPDRPVSI
ncbi:MAG: hypothetical protein RLZZ592_1155 [Pseudomonadota bacterium]